MPEIPFTILMTGESVIGAVHFFAGPSRISVPMKSFSATPKQGLDSAQSCSLIGPGCPLKFKLRDSHPIKASARKFFVLPKFVVTSFSLSELAREATPLIRPSDELRIKHP